MDWASTVTVIATLGFGISTLVLALRLRRNKQPVWSYATRKIIGTGGEAPEEVKLMFNDEEVADVYHTLAVFFNKGSEPIRREDVARCIRLDLCHGRLLRDPKVLATSKEENRFSASHAGDRTVELDFQYLGRDDGACVEMLHTGGRVFSVSGTVIDAKITKVQGFARCLRAPDAGRWVVLTMFAAALALLSLFVVQSIGREEVGLEQAITIAVLSGYSIFVFRVLVYPVWIQRLRFPAWCRDVRSAAVMREAGGLSAD